MTTPRPERPEPPLTPALRAEARTRPNSWLYATDPAFGPDEQVPPFGVIGGWQVDGRGEVAGYWANPTYRPSPQALGLPAPHGPLEALLQRAATGYAADDELAAAVADGPLLVVARPEADALYLVDDAVEACTSPELVPAAWPGWREVTGRQLAEALPGAVVRLNPGSRVSVTVPLAELPVARAAGSTLPPLSAGRRPAGQALLSWLADPAAPRACLVTGSSGSGRSHLVRWLASACPPDEPRPTRRVHAVLDATGLGPRGAAWRLGRAFARATGSPEALLAEFARLPRTGPLVIAVTDLHRAADPAGISEQLLGPLLTLPGLRLLVEGDRPELPGSAVLDLDEPRWTDARLFGSWCARLGAPADAVYPSPTLGLLAAAAPGGAEAADVCRQWWEALPAELRPTVRALAAAGQPLTAGQWAALPGSGGAEAVRRCALLLPAEPDGRSWRLRPDRLVELAAADAPLPAPAELTDALLRQLPRRPDGELDTGAAEPELVELLAACALRSHGPLELLEKADVLVRATTATVAATLDQVPEQLRATRKVRAWELAGPALTAAADLGTRATVASFHLLAQDPRPRPGLPWRIVWARWEPTVALAPGQGPYAGAVLVLDADGRLHELDQADGSHRNPPGDWPGPALPDALACTPQGGLLTLDQVRPVVPEPTALAATAAGPAVGDAGGSLHWLPGGLRSPEPLHPGPVTAVAAALLDGAPLLASGGQDGGVRLWAPGHALAPDPVDHRRVGVSAVALGGRLLVAAWADGLVRLRRLTAGGGTSDLLLGAPVHSAAVGAEGRILLATRDGVLALEWPE
ncbi:type VII secretion system-associated protein [Kitasatospora sp. NPDC006697]|uniref:type VII secretion system-associated protein n=1 Tax=Kitasatospora sp. NPDC006697 TaxID=3364020 RepID=UPI0036ACA776